jgi:hypothetical protein
LEPRRSTTPTRQFLQALRQQRLRHQRNAAADIAEVRAAGEHFGDHERRPPLGDDLGGLGNRAELAIAHHGAIILQIRGLVAPVYGANMGAALRHSAGIDERAARQS